MARLASLTARRLESPPAARETPIRSTATVADITTRRRSPRRRPVVLWEPDWLARYQALKTRVEAGGDPAGRERLLLIRRLIARSRFADVRTLLEREPLAAAPHHPAIRSA